MSLRKAVPWWGRYYGKLILSALPVPYSMWRRLGLFRHGDMNDPAPAFEKFRSHFESAHAVRPIPENFTALELGPGDSLFSAVATRGWGGAGSVLLDAGAFAVRDVPAYRNAARLLAEQGRQSAAFAAVQEATDFDAVLSALNARYLTGGTASMAEIPDASVDFIWSCVVLEHVPREEFDIMAREMRRVLRPGGVMGHSIDLRDHMGGGLNNLRFPAEAWETARIRDAGLYTNRLGYRDILEAFRNAGFAWKIGKVDRWPAPPLPRARMQPEFRGRSDEDLTIAGFDIVLWPADDGADVARVATDRKEDAEA
ncbi:hypothetical protein C882_3396 [Caenispirillum salinarum AK4]|uniref:Methyltransferase type 11 domain-containing protein n=1 Tax=Caenispirillum salinarum AK4 TaxID=1238182 RepID=K9HAU8_9PROT|nr:class I SAM-dependent methyltransferase [Caenispirillum salinarum]EKV25911.1 hypothetical protein C882_3396 [Caenispirillum salinarum AK4]